MSGRKWKEHMASKITLHSSSKKRRKVILCNVEITKREKQTNKQKKMSTLAVGHHKCPEN